MKKSAVLIVILVVNGIMSNVFSQTKTSLKNLLNNVVEDAVNSVTNKITTLTPEDIAGTWKYSAPACEFESGEVLKDAGGKLIAAEVESQLTDIYSKAGITASTFGYSFADSTFTNQYKKINLKFPQRDRQANRYDLPSGRAYPPGRVVGQDRKKRGQTCLALRCAETGEDIVDLVGQDFEHDAENGKLNFIKLQECSYRI